MAASPSIHLRSVLQVAPYLATRGVAPLDFFRRMGFTPNVFQQADLWLPRHQCFAMANEMARVANDPFGGAQVGYLTDLPTLGEWGRMVLQAETVAQACRVAAANAALLHQGGEVQVVTEGQTTRLIHRFTGQYGADPRQFVLGSLAVLRKLPLLAGDASAVRVHLKERGGRGDDSLEQSFGSAVNFGGDFDMIEFDRSLLALPLRRVSGVATRQAEAVQTTVDAATRLIDGLALQQPLTLPAIAAAMRLAPRTLQRRLKHCGVEFEALRDETRRGEAMRLLALGGHTATDIAHLVGYSDSAHFTRAFRRWTGLPPSRFAPILEHGGGRLRA